MRQRAKVPGMQAGGVLLGAKPQGAAITYPLIVETILHACGVNAVPMEDGAVMVRFPSTNGMVTSIPLSAKGVDELVKQLENARGLTGAAGDGGVSEPSDDQPSVEPGGTE
ncbi:MAG TPA: hypothetical protein VFX78_00025 [Candidatus Eisenbacteria bacterium]|nr:hypothetical protein [Candidatus Eisenbacteria bacterium]